MNTPPTAKQVAIDLLKIHTHVEKDGFDETYFSDGEIVYREKDIIELLKKYGLPEPDFDELTPEDFSC